jgi:hypothetical protein
MMSSPEPMTLGSPTQSPTASNAINQYLPQFLLGDLPSAASSSLHPNSQYGGGHSANSLNPYHPQSYHMGSHHHHGNQHFLNPSSGLSRELSMNNPGGFHHYGSTGGPNGGSSSYSPHNERSMGNMLGGMDTKPQIPGGPPLNRLADVLNKPSGAGGSNNNSMFMMNTPNDVQRTKLFNNNASYYSGGGVDMYGMDSGLNKLNIQSQLQQQDLPFTPAGCTNNISLSSQQRLSASPTNIESFYYNDSMRLDDTRNGGGGGEDNGLSCWITIFGFPPSSATYVLQEFSVCGQIVRHIVCAQGNWMHIQYQTKLQAQKALDKNGKVLGNSIMVGVMKCIDKSVLQGGENSNTSGGVAADNSTFVSPAASNSILNPGNRLAGKTFNGVNSGGKLDRSQSLRTGVRPPLGSLNQNGVR